MQPQPEHAQPALLRIKCASGVVTVTAQAITLTRSTRDIVGQHMERMLRANITGVHLQPVGASLFGLGGASTVTVRGIAQEKMVLRFIKPALAKQLVALLQPPQ